MIFGFGKKQVEEEPEVEYVHFQGALNGKDADLASNAKLVQTGLIPTKELITSALSRRAETIRLEPKGENFVSTYLVDGLAYPSTRFPKPIGNAIVQMIKTLSGLDIGQRKKPQSGGLRAELDGTSFELFVDSTPVVGGAERLMVRIRDLSRKMEDPEELGITDDLKSKIRELTSEHSGVLLVCGGPLSGTTTTKFGVIRSIDPFTHSIYSIANLGTQELDNVTQFEVNPGDDLETTLSRLERIEADIVILDPIEDAKAAVAVFSNCKNMLLISEFRAKDTAAGARQLFEWMFVGGADPKLVADGLKGIFSQKLIRLLCKRCKEAYKPNPKMVAKVGLPEDTTVLYRPLQKEEIAAKIEAGEKVPCAETGGYQGRTGLFELLEMSDEMRKLIASNAEVDKLKALARKQQMHSVQQDGLRLVAEGKTSLEELQRVFKS